MVLNEGKHIKKLSLLVSVKSLKLCVSTYTRLCTYIAVFLFLYNAKTKPYIGRNQSP